MDKIDLDECIKDYNVADFLIYIDIIILYKDVNNNDLLDKYEKMFLKKIANRIFKKSSINKDIDVYII